MAENKIELKTIGELLGMKFFIPSYQRGYRWTEQQVKDLLNDIEEFRLRTKSITDFYCLQPLVVKENIDNKNSFLNNLPKATDIENDVLGLTRKAIAEHTKWEVIDGQQRLTTIFIILSYLFSDIERNKLYSIDYETRRKFNEFWEEIINKNLCCLETNETDLKGIINTKFDEIKKNKDFDNIDFYHILQTLITVEYWFNINNSIDKNEFKKTILNRVKFIWYESISEDPINVFTRLNIGKISLTNAELIKALFLNQSNFPNIDKNSLKLKQQEIASEWDNIEYTLQNDEFWLFLHKNGYNRPTRIDFIFDLICKQNAMKLYKKKYETIGTDGYRTFRYFYEYFKQGSSEQDTMQDSKQKTKIESCWYEVKKYFQTFQEWFNDLQLFHFVGFLVECKYTLTDLIKQWDEKKDKESFINYLKKEITKKIKIPDGKYFCDDNHIEESLHFDSHKDLIRKILLMHNIQTVINQNKQLKENDDYQLPVFYKFPFHLFKKEVWNVEHIDSNTSNELTELKQQKEWLLAAWIVVVSEKLKEDIRLFIQNDSSVGFDDLHNRVLQEIGEGKEKEKLNDSERMLIWNLALLDESTNKGYHNDIFTLKRKCLIGKDQGVIIDSTIKEEEGDIKIEMTKPPASISFIPVCTKNAFLKYYTPVTNNLMDWDKTDATEYKKNILETLKDFGVNDSSNKQSEESNG